MKLNPNIIIDISWKTEGKIYAQVRFQNSRGNSYNIK